MSHQTGGAVRAVNDELLETSLFGRTDDPREGRTSCEAGWPSLLGFAWKSIIQLIV